VSGAGHPMMERGQTKECLGGGPSVTPNINWTLQQQVHQEVAPFSSAVAVFFSPPPLPPYLIPLVVLLAVGEHMKSTREKKGQNKSPCCVLWGDETQAVSHEMTKQGSTPRHAKTSLEGIQSRTTWPNHVDKRYIRYKKICSSGQKICEEQG
jgi:hypothetical protein